MCLETRKNLSNSYLTCIKMIHNPVAMFVLIVLRWHAFILHYYVVQIYDLQELELHNPPPIKTIWTMTYNNTRSEILDISTLTVTANGQGRLSRSKHLSFSYVYNFYFVCISTLNFCFRQWHILYILSYKHGSCSWTFPSGGNG